MKQFLAFIVSFQLITFPLTAEAIERRFREDSQDVSPSAHQALETNHGEDATVTDAKGDQKSYSYDVSQVKSTGYRFYTFQPLAYALSMLGMSLPFSCGNPALPSIAAYAAGSLALITMEIQAAKEQEERHKALMEELKNIQENVIVGEVQLEAIKKKKEEEEHIRDFLKKRLDRVNITKIMYLTAAGLALAEEAAGRGAAAAAAAPVCSGIAAMLCAGALIYPPCYAANYAGCMGFHPTGYTTATASFLLWSPGSIAAGNASCGAGGPYAPGCTTALPAYLPLTHPYCSPVGAALISSVINILSLSFAFNTDFSAYYKTDHEYRVLFPKLLELMVPAVALTFTPFMNYPIPRSVAFGVAATLMEVISNGLEDRKTMVEKNIAKFNILLEDFKKNTQVANALQKDPAEEPVDKEIPEIVVEKDYIPTKKEENTDDLPGSNIKRLKCFSKDKGVIDFSEAGCKKPIQIAKAPKIRRPVPIRSNPIRSRQERFSSATDLIPFTEILEKAGSVSTELGNALNTGDDKKAQVASAELQKLNEQVNKAFTALKQDFDKKGKEEGKEGFKTYDQQVAGLLKSLEGDFDKAANESGFKAQMIKAQPIASASVPSAQAIPDAPELSAPGIASPSPFQGSLYNSIGSESAHSGNNLTEEERDAVLRNYRREKSDFERADEDGLFKILSKAYVRNLDKIMNRKKKKEE